MYERVRRARSRYMLALVLVGVALFAVAPVARPLAADSGPSFCASLQAQARVLRPGVDYDASLPAVTAYNECGQQIPLVLEVAANNAQREQGLMNVTYLPPFQGELFAFPDLFGGQPVRISFWMEDTYLPLSIAFLSKDGIVQEIQDMQPLTVDLHTPAQTYTYAIEVNQGWFASNGIVPGSYIDLAPALAKLPATFVP